MGTRVRLVLLDLTMPLMTGRDALRQLRAMRPDLPILLCSGFSRDSTPQPEPDRYTTFLQKPYTLVGLAQVVRQTLRP